MMTNEIHCKMYKQMYWGKIFYLKEFCPFLQFLLIEEGNCNNSDLSHQIAVKSIAIEIISDTCVFERKQLISVHDAALAEFFLTRGEKNITIFFKYFKEPSLTCLASQSLFLHCHQQEVFTLRLQGWFIIEQSFLWFGEKSKSHGNLFCCHLCFPTLQMTLEATDGKQRSSKRLSSHFGPTVRCWCLSANIILLLTAWKFVGF